ncbi:hypothetical protein JCM3770_006338 [Rhodotorula araucariae]
MPVLLVPASYAAGTTATTTAPEAEGRNLEGVLVETTMGELLPLSFGPEDLDKPRTGGGADNTAVRGAGRGEYCA